MKKQPIITAAMLSAAVLTGAAFGPSIAGAQSDEPTEPATDTTVAAGDEAKPEGARPEGRGGRGDKGVAVAELLGLSQDEVRTALSEGQTIADLAAAQGIDIDTVIDAIIAGISEHIQEHLAAGDITAAEAEEKVAAAEERVTDKVTTVQTPGEQGRRGGQGKEALAEALGMTVDELEAAKDSGTSIRDLAEDAGVDLPEPGERGGRGGHRGPRGDAAEAGDA